MLSVFLSACLLSFLTLVTHASGIAVLLRRFMGLQHFPETPSGIVQMLVRMIWWLVLLHLAEILMWGLFYWWRGLFSDAEAAFYFSGSSYTTLGYGDVLLVFADSAKWKTPVLQRAFFFPRSTLSVFCP